MAKPKTIYEVNPSQMKQLDAVRQSLYMLSMEDLPRPLGEQIAAASWSLYYWLGQFTQPVPLKDMPNKKDSEGKLDSWPSDIHELWEAHK